MDENNNSVIVVDKLSKSFGPKLVVDEVSFQIQRGEIFGFLGPNGSGKSTVIRMLCGVLAPTSGQAFVEGINANEASNLVRRKVGYVSQKFGLYADLTVKQNMEFYGRIYGIAEARIQERIEELCHKTKLAPYLHNKAETLSGGWKQRLALACAILHEPSVLFLDEPTAGIDPVARREVWDLLFELSSEGMTMLVTTHYMDEAERCHRVGYIYLSKLIAYGSIDELVNSPDLYPPGHEQVVIRSQATMNLYKILNSLDFVSNVTLFGKDIHCVVPSRFIASVGAKEELKQIFLQKLLALPAQSNLVVNTLPEPEISIEKSLVSLEDVFVALTKKQAINASLGQEVKQ